MQVIPIKTRIVQPPQDTIEDLFDGLALQEKDVLVVTSKIVSIWRGNAVPLDSISKRDLVIQEADLYWEVPDRKSPLTIKHSVIISSAGVDESNADGYYLTLPKDPWSDASEIRSILQKKYNLSEVGVVISDSHSLPMRYGAMGVALACAGFRPVIHYVGEKDLFGREFVYERFDLADSLASTSTVVSGEGSESCPLTIIRDIPRIEFTDFVDPQSLLIPPEEDMYKALLRPFFK